MALARKYRIKSDKEFDRAFRFGKVFVGRGETIRLIPNNIGWPRFGVIVSAKKFPLAIERNKIKRAMFSEAARIISKFESGYDVVMIAQTNYSKDADELLTLIKKAPGWPGIKK